jgi:hypothetical protein
MWTIIARSLVRVTGTGSVPCDIWFLAVWSFTPHDVFREYFQRD